MVHGHPGDQWIRFVEQPVGQVKAVCHTSFLAWPHARQNIERRRNNFLFPRLQEIAAVQNVRRARQSYETAKQAWDDKDPLGFQRHMRESHQSLEQALDRLRSSIEHWASAVRDPSDLGALGVLNGFCYDYLKGIALDVYLQSERTSFIF